MQQNCVFLYERHNFTNNWEFTSNYVCICFQALRDWVAIESDSSNVLKRPELHRMMEKVAQKLRQMGGTVELVDIGEQEVIDGAHL